MSRSPVYSKAIFFKVRESRRSGERRNHRNCTNFLTDLLMQFYWDGVTSEDGTMSVRLFIARQFFVKVREAKRGDVVKRC